MLSKSTIDTLKRPMTNAEAKFQESSLEEGSHVAEKANVQHVDLDRAGETQGYVLDEAALRKQRGFSADARLKTASAKDGVWFSFRNRWTTR
jgi:hypothetical protein